MGKRITLTEKQRIDAYVEQTCQEAVGSISMAGARKLLDKRGTAQMAQLSDSTWRRWRGGGMADASLKDALKALYLAGYKIAIVAR